MTRRLLLYLFFAVFTIQVARTPAAAFERFDFDQRYLIDPGFIIKDHSVVKDGALFHIFYIRADENVPEQDRAKALGHATSTDLKHWTIHPEVVPVVPNTWENSYVWAPHVVKHNGVWYLFYTGVNSVFSQAIGVALSPDLFTWIKAPTNPIYRPSSSWADWTASDWANCRDPFVFPDGTGTWHLVTTAWTNTSKGALSHATSNDLLQWSDQGPLFVHPGPNAWHVLESANLHQAHGKWHLTFTEQNIGGSSYLQANSFLGPWNFSEREPFDAGHATELFQVDGEWMLTRHTTFRSQGAARYVIRFDDVDWRDAAKPLIAWDEPLRDWTVWSGNAFYLQPVFWDNSRERGGDSAQFGGNSWIGTYELFTGPLRVGFPGLTAGDAPVGVLRSETFTLTGNSLRFRIGGGRDLDRLYVAIYTADDGQLRRRATGDLSDTMVPVEWYLGDFTGRPVFVEIADLSSAVWGHINVDEIEEFLDADPTDVGRSPRTRLVLHPNSPNPFNPGTRISFDLPETGQAQLVLFDVRGRVVTTLWDGRLTAGRHTFDWNGRRTDGSQATSGVYYSRLRANGEEQENTMTLVR